VRRRETPSSLRAVKKKAGRPLGNVLARSLHPSSLAEVRLVAVHHAFYPRAHCETIVHRTSHPVPVPMTSAMGIFTRESLIPPWESSLTSGGERSAHIATIRSPYIHMARDPIRLHLPQSRHNAVLCAATLEVVKREEYA